MIIECLELKLFKIFAENYKFSSEEAAIEYMESQLMKLNENSKIEEEKKFLKLLSENIFCRLKSIKCGYLQ